MAKMKLSLKRLGVTYLSMTDQTLLGLSLAKRNAEETLVYPYENCSNSCLI
jgi:hypothetical protein